MGQKLSKDLFIFNEDTPNSQTKLEMSAKIIKLCKYLIRHRTRGTMNGFRLFPFYNIVQKDKCFNPFKN